MAKKFYIGLTGRAFSGKDTVGNKLVEVFAEKGIIAKRVALADDLKAQCADALDLRVSDFYDPALKEDLRPFMQFMGDFRKNPKFGGYQMYWCDVLGTRTSQEEDVEVFIVSDIRYDFEAEWVRKFNGGMIVRVFGKNAPETAHSSHASEAGFDDSLIDYHFMNDHSLGIEKLDSLVRTLVEEIIEPRRAVNPY
jgi:hypothetical protein